MAKAKKAKPVKSSDPREEGIKAIIYLQKMNDIDEPRDVAEANWDDFSDHEKEVTLSTYKMLNPAS